MARDGKTLLINQAKKNISLQELIDSVDDLSHDEIDVINQPKWIRDALTKIKSDNAAAIVSNYALDNCIAGFSEDFIGIIYKWVGEEEFKKFNVFDVMISPGDLIFVSDRGTWLDTSFASSAADIIYKCTPVKKALYSEYRTEIRKATNDKHQFKDAPPLFTIKK